MFILFNLMLMDCNKRKKVFIVDMDREKHGVIIELMSALTCVNRN